MARLLAIPGRSHQHLVAIRRCYPAQHVMVPPQHHLMDEDQTIPIPDLEPGLPVFLPAVVPLLGY